MFHHRIIVQVLLVTSFFCQLLNSANALFELQCTLHTYVNVRHTLGIPSNIQCCDGNNSPDMCSQSCDNKFVFCLREFSTTTQDIGPTCTHGVVSARPNSIDTIVFVTGQAVFQLSPSSATSSAPNPIIFTGGTWSDVAQFVIEVVDADDPMGAENDQYIDTVVVDLSALTPSNTITPITAYSGLLGHAVFNMSFRLVCSANYYGDNCSKFCEGRYNDLGHYRCDEQGNIVCKTGYTDESTNCVQCIPLTNCSSDGGYCNNPGECLCNPGYNGMLCENDHDPCGHQEPCLHGGNCTNVGSNKYHCSCPASYVGDNCQRNLSECTVGSCMNEGNCENDQCVCKEGYSGVLCDNSESPWIVTIVTLVLCTVVLVVFITTVLIVCLLTKRQSKGQKMTRMDVDVLSPTCTIELQRNDSYACLDLQGVNNQPFYSIIPLSNGPAHSASLQSTTKLPLQEPSEPQYYVNEGLGPPLQH